MKHLFSILAGVLLASCASAAKAQDDASNTPAYESCLDRASGVTVSMRECISEEHARQDTLLNEAYRDLMRRLGTEGQTDLRNAQRAWIAFREAECAYRGSGETGTIGPVIIDSCWLGFTTERAATLRRDLAFVTEWGALN
jgi:uncharacterized protein YecT (DUF1311 family)